VLILNRPKTGEQNQQGKPHWLSSNLLKGSSILKAAAEGLLKIVYKHVKQ
jgi:hypothetical protein